MLHRAVAPQREQSCRRGDHAGRGGRHPAAVPGRLEPAASTPAELRALLDAYLRDEMAYREGVALGLDRDDALIRRRVRQKFELLAEEEGAAGPPDDAALAAYLDLHRDRYQPPPLVGFEQILLPEDDAARDAVLRSLAADADPAELGRSSLLPTYGSSPCRSTLSRATSAPSSPRRWRPSRLIPGGSLSHRPMAPTWSASAPAPYPRHRRWTWCAPRWRETGRPDRRTKRDRGDLRPAAREIPRGDRGDAAGHRPPVIRLLLAWLLLLASPAAADEFRPAYLQITQRDATTYDILWKLPAIDEDRTLRLTPAFPPEAATIVPPRMGFAGGTGVLRWRIAVAGGSGGQGDRFSRAVGHPHRRAGAVGPRRRHGTTRPHPAGRAALRRAGPAPGRFAVAVDLPIGLAIDAHPGRLRPPAVRAGIGPAGAGARVA